MSVFLQNLSQNLKYSNMFLLMSQLNSKTLLNLKSPLICLMFSLVIKLSFLFNQSNTVWEPQIKSFTWLTTAMKPKKKSLLGNCWCLRVTNRSLNKIIWKHSSRRKSMKSTTQNLKETFVCWCLLLTQNQF